MVVTIFDFNFKLSASTEYTGVALSRYLSLYGSSVNIVSLCCLLFGISNITRFLGVGTALALMPLIVGTALVGFLSMNTLAFLFVLMVGSKAINYALNGPSVKQLYVPTTKDVKYKSQAWIETFGSRSSKGFGSLFNALRIPFTAKWGAEAGILFHIAVSTYLSVGLLVAWFVVALYLGKTYQRAVDRDEVVC